MSQDGGLEPCLTFAPTDSELTDDFLRSKIVAGDPPPASFIHDADVYSAAPEQLVADRQAAPGTGNGDGEPVWYFFSPVRYMSKRPGGSRRKSRTVDGTDGKASWHSEIGQRVVKGSAVGGKLQKFTYKVDDVTNPRPSEAKKHGGWLMVEYSIAGADDLVLCKFYRSTRTPLSSSTSVAAVSAGSSIYHTKRTAEGHHTEARQPVRRRIDEENEAFTASAEVPLPLQPYEDRAEMQQDDPCTFLDDFDFHALEGISFSFDTVDGKTEFLDAGVTVCDLLQSAQVAPTEEIVGLGSSTDWHKEQVDGPFSTALLEGNGGLPCPSSQRSARDAILSALGEMTWPAFDGGQLSPCIPPSCRNEDAIPSALFGPSYDAFWSTQYGF